MIITMAWRNIWRHKARSLVIMMSIALGLLSGVAVLALYEGMLYSRIRTVIDEETGHIQIHHPKFSDENESKYVLTNTTQILKILKNIPEVNQVNQRTLINGMLSTSTGTSGVKIIGIDTISEYQYSALENKLKEGQKFLSDKKFQVIIGGKLAVKMKLKLGSKLVLMFNDTTNNLVSSAFKVTGIYQSSNIPLDERLIYVLGSELSELAGIPGRTHEIGLKLTHDQSVDSIAKKLRIQMPNLKIETWKEISPETEFMVKTVDSYSYIILIIIMIALAFGILNTMLMAIMERTREIGMIAALGTSKIRIFFLVMLETVFLTLGGAPLGILLGWILSAYFNKTGLNLAGMGEDMMGNFGFKTMIYPEFPAEKLLPLMLIVVITALLSSLIPALKAINMKPIDALKN